ncbi:MAG: reductive dehalogenase [Rhodospirillaceae bacterium]|jgi:reductive dehalogenase|nr:reductive dehalogenase [Rhodospirillaceae bacterium]MBT5457087.1 reductive dehalogenase [Rhodospirillaceae bacterium]
MNIFSRRSRPMHMGKFPMEKIRRVDKPTTYISDDVKRVPMRANFFTRAAMGDLGKKAQHERKFRFAKTPLSMALRNMSKSHDDIHDGPVADEKAPISSDPKEITEHIKSMCHFLDVDMVGICEVPDYAWYSHDLDGNEITPYHKYAIVLVFDQGFETLDAASGDDWISNAQSQRAYLIGSTVSCVVADYIRQLGWPARAQTATKSDVLHLPLTLLSGMGELSRIGELVLNPFLGPRFKTSVITTDLPLEIDKPIDFGLQDFCNKCMKCANECPCNAISFGDKIMYNGYEMWKPDVEKCTLYRVTNQKGASCGRCMKMCPFNKEGLFTHRIALWLAIKVPALRGLLARADDWFEYGKRMVKNKWWWDHENIDGEYVIAKAANERDLKKDLKPRGEDRYAVFPPDTMPPPGTREPFPIDRPAGVKARAEAEKAPQDRR